MRLVVSCVVGAGSAVVLNWVLRQGLSDSSRGFGQQTGLVNRD